MGMKGSPHSTSGEHTALHIILMEDCMQYDKAC